MRWLSLIHPNLLRMPSHMELDTAPHRLLGPSEHDPGGREAGLNDGTGAVVRKDMSNGRLPREILSEILAEACDVENTVGAEYLTTTLTPLRLTHVSKAWREVAISTPRMWKHLQVVVKGTETNSALELVKLWVPRCKQQPCKIDVFFRDKQGPLIIYPEDSLNLFRVVTKTAGLLREELNVNLDKAFFETHVKVGNTGVLPFVEEKYLWYYGVDDLPDKSDVPKLPLVVRGARRAVDEFGFGHHGPFSSSLTRLELLDTNGVTCLSTMELLIILAEFRQLRYLSASLDHVDSPPAEQVTTNLLTFKLSWSYTTDPGEVFDHLSAPHITEMELSGDIPAGAAWNHLYDFLARNRPPIATLAFENFDATAGVTHLADCLSLLDRIENLWLENCIVDDEFIASLGRRNVLAENSVLSRLRSFGLVSAEEMTGDCLIQTLRNADTSSLRELFVFDCDGVLQEHCEEITALFSDTVHVDIMVTPGEPFDQ